MEKHAFYYREDAHYMAQLIQPKGGRLVDGSADTSGFECPRELDSWQGSIGCIFVEDAKGVVMAAVGYWTNVEAEREALKWRGGWMGVESPLGRAVFESEAEAFAYAAELKKKGVKTRKIDFFDPSEPVARRFISDEELKETEKWIKEQRKADEPDDWGEGAKCPRCGYSQSINDWINEAYFDLDGRDVAHPIGGDHARCPNCGKLLCINYDLIEE